MVFYNRGMALRPVHRIKHVIDLQGGLVIGAQTNVDLIKTVDAPVITNATEVETGSKVNGLFLKVEVNAVTSAALPNCYLTIFKNPGGVLTPPAANAVGISALKKYVIHEEMVMLQQQDRSNPRTLFVGVIKIPRGYIRNGPLDKLQLSLLSPGVTQNFCVQAHYKEFR